MDFQPNGVHLSHVITYAPFFNIRIKLSLCELVIRLLHILIDK